MSKSPVFVKPFLKNLETLKEFECTVCFEIDPFMYRCSGPSNRPFVLGAAPLLTTQSMALVVRCAPSAALQN